MGQWDGKTYRNDVLPARPSGDVRAMPEAEFQEYRRVLGVIILDCSRPDGERETALQQLFEADRRLWPNRLANGNLRAA